MSDLNATIQRVLELDKQAIPKPWTHYTREEAIAAGCDTVGNATHLILGEHPVYGDVVVASVGDATTPPEGEEREARLIAEYRTAAPELARALIETQAALAAAEEGRLAALDIAKGAYEERDALRSELQAANARADAAEETGDAAERDADHYQSDRDALELRGDGLNADLARVTAERDEQGRNAVAMFDEAKRRQSEAATAREAVRELVDGLRFAKDHLVDTHDCDETTTIDALLAKHAAPAPTPADAKESPAAVPGLVFGAPDAAGVLLRLLRERVGDMPRHEECLTFNGRPSLTPSDDGDWLKRSDVLAALDPNAHNAARLKGGE